jgi:hypothetical protein
VAPSLGGWDELAAANWALDAFSERANAHRARADAAKATRLPPTPSASSEEASAATRAGRVQAVKKAVKARAQRRRESKGAALGPRASRERVRGGQAGTLPGHGAPPDTGAAPPVETAPERPVARSWAFLAPSALVIACLFAVLVGRRAARKTPRAAPSRQVTGGRQWRAQVEATAAAVQRAKEAAWKAKLLPKGASNRP